MYVFTDEWSRAYRNKLVIVSAECVLIKISGFGKS